MIVVCKTRAPIMMSALKVLAQSAATLGSGLSHPGVVLPSLDFITLIFGRRCSDERPEKESLFEENQAGTYA